MAPPGARTTLPDSTVQEVQVMIPKSRQCSTPLIRCVTTSLLLFTVRQDVQSVGGDSLQMSPAAAAQSTRDIVGRGARVQYDPSRDVMRPNGPGGPLLGAPPFLPPWDSLIVEPSV